MLKVKIRKEFDYIPTYEQPFIGRVKVFLPAEEGYIEKPFRKRDVYLLDEELCSCWGLYEEDKDGKWRFKIYVANRSSWEEVEKDLNEKIEETLNTLRQVYREYMQNIESMPDKEERIYNIE